MKVFVTGGAGFIGSHAVDYHLKKNDEVWALDNLISGKEANLAEAKQNRQFRFDQGDVSNWGKLGEALSWADRVYHFAAYVGQYLVLQHPYEALAKNIQGLQEILRHTANNKKPCSLIVASSSEVYGAQSSFQEEETILFPSGEYLQQCYRLAKLVNEVMALSKDVDRLVIVRLFNTIGPRQTGHYGMVVPSFIAQAVRNASLRVFGDGSQTRSFCHVRDSITAMDSLLNTSQAHRQIVNVGSDEEISILDLAKRIIRKTNSSSDIVHVDYKTAYGCDFKDIPRRRPDLKKLKSLIDFHPQFTLDSTLGQMIQIIRQ